jgi:hypothetical protein
VLCSIGSCCNTPYDTFEFPAAYALISWRRDPNTIIFLQQFGYVCHVSNIKAVWAFPKGGDAAASVGTTTALTVVSDLGLEYSHDFVQGDYVERSVPGDYRRFCIDAMQRGSSWTWPTFGNISSFGKKPVYDLEKSGTCAWTRVEPSVSRYYENQWRTVDVLGALEAVFSNIPKSSIVQQL